MRIAMPRRSTPAPAPGDCGVALAEPGDLAAVAERIAAEIARPGKKRIAVASGLRRNVRNAIATTKGDKASI